ncbi:uncharacterized protein PHACADRAFT_260066 [Phanerochaete carnosa HHB-10118-sp]|uniref:Uncharacterized protein n=1 Tax=Phanerochaete carnosa (strain HHB-10118-sp) TaxID=650164 RepID=K5W3V2_PHACS|nr:uncharacterized protein PHACADRAFT_260066 [Phanerochaete carnosa HHB-10118-sp]EKM53619.1 hypothetical protein PHACADRAFT_260066 [Phanerochaete carnosa HHB-10118-sp]
MCPNATDSFPNPNPSLNALEGFKPMASMSRHRRPMPPNRSGSAPSHLYMGPRRTMAQRRSLSAAPTMPPVVLRIPVVPVPLSNLTSR